MQQDTPAQQYSNFDVKMAWNIELNGTESVIAGFICNIRYTMMEDIEIWVSLLDAQGKTYCRAGDIVMPKRVNRNETATFRVTLPTVVPHGAKLVFTYRYNGYDGGDGTKWMQSFESNAP